LKLRFLSDDIRMLAGEARHNASDRPEILGSHPGWKPACDLK
jgi:hypothetical protein